MVGILVSAYRSPREGYLSEGYGLTTEVHGTTQNRGGCVKDNLDVREAIVRTNVR